MEDFRCPYGFTVKPAAAPYVIIALCCIANFINAADRVLMPITIISMADEFDWDLHFQGWILSSFSVGYLSSLVAGGSAAKNFGGRRVLTLAVLLWSLSSFLTPFFASSWPLMILFRFLLGVGEGIGLPTIFHIFSHTVPVEERGRAFSYLIALGSVGQFVAGIISPHLPWPLPFLLFGGSGLLWVITWVLFTKSFGDFEHPGSSDYPVSTPPLNGSMRWRDFFSHRSLWAIYAAHFSMNWSNYIIMQWLPTYLVRSLGGGRFEVTLTALPYITNSICGIAAGHWADNLVRQRWSVLWVRRLMTSVGLIGPGCLLFIFSASTSIPLAVFLISISMGLSASNSAGHLAAHAEVAPNHAGITFAISNTLATIPGILCGPLTAYLVTEYSGHWLSVFIIAGFVNIFGAAVYLCYSTASPVM
ncbi:Sodium-dependent phosphate transport protein 1, chloroplastic [Echinococcus granulosus]|uniref:Sodium dependent phosphate transport protein 1 n=1 Tax=Echinococcus granulosus TaxID=6210 RepID=A0A068WP28_ECHGR|nr:Sodium-dependent phosphate transport protein 1, chloroplastic [Echinococcus granulosus]CDS19431.1 sodium dependent phosphate transport protein 1 [Echinococcus granulosus]